MDEKDPTNVPEESMGASDSGATNAEAASQETMPVEQPATAVGEPQAVPAIEPEPAQAVPAAGQPAQTQPMPPMGQPVPTQPMPPQGAPYAGAPVPTGQPSPTGVLVCGILAIVFCFIPSVGIVLGIVAIVLAGKYFKAGGTQGQGKAGRICGIVGLVLSIIMIIVNSVLIVLGLSVLDEADVDFTDIYASQSSSAISSSAVSSALDDRLNDELYAVVDPELDKIKSAEPAMVATIAAIIEESLNSELASENLSLADLKVDPTELAKAMIQGFDYEYDSTDIDGSEGTGEAWYTITCKDTYSIATEFEAQISTLLSGDVSQYSTMEAAYEAIGKALMDAVNSTTPTDDSMVDYDLTKQGDKWVLDPESWTDELDYLFAF